MPYVFFFGTRLELTTILIIWDGGKLYPAGEIASCHL